MKRNLSEYGYYRVGVVTPQMKVADVNYNTERICNIIDEAVQNNCNLVLFPELSITGYTCADLFFQKGLLDASLEALLKIAEKTKINKTTVVVGSPIADNGRLYNCAVFISDGEILGIVPKTYLANYNEFYEERWFTSDFYRNNNYININDKQIPFGTDIIFNNIALKNCKIGIEICEDLWAVIPPSFSLAIAGATILLNLSASDEYLDKYKYRRNLVLTQSGRCISAYCYSSAGPNESSTDIVFPGHSMIAENGAIFAETERYNFNSQIIYSDIDINKIINDRQKNKTFSKQLATKTFRVINYSSHALIDDKLLRNFSYTPFIPKNLNERAEKCREIFNIQKTALAKRLLHIGCQNTVIGLSGGLDSTLALLVCLQTYKQLNLDIKKINAISMPGFGTSKRTKNNAYELAKLLKIGYQEISIHESVEQHFEDIGHNPNKHNVVFENAQARERTQILMDIANQVDGIVIGTGDLSEIALGWSTYNGDHISMYGVNCGVPKTLVKYIIEWCAEEKYSGEIALILKDIISTPISPELLPIDENNEIQETEKYIGPYLLNDFFLYYSIRCNFPPKKILFLAEIAFKDMFDRDEIINALKNYYIRFFNNQFKRTCIPDGPKVGTIALSPRGDWRMATDSCYNLWVEELEKLD